MDRFESQFSAQNIVGTGLWDLRLWHRDPDLKTFGSTPIKSFESAVYASMIRF
jgi:hypothetical protein